MRSTISPPNVLTVRSNSEMWRVMSAPSVPLSRANFSASSPPWSLTNSSNALICSESESWAVSVWVTTLATSEFTVTSSASLALSPEVRMRVASRLPASSILLTRSPERSSSSSNSESEEFFRLSWTCSVRSEMPSTMVEERCSNSLVMRSMRSFSISWTRSARSTNSSWTCPVLKLRLVVRRSEASSTAGGLGTGFLEAIEQVAAALAGRENHVVAGIAERAGDVGAAFFQRAGDALGDLVDARGDRMRDQRDIVAQVDLDAGNGAADLFGLADQIVALMGDVLQQRADAHLVVAIGALQRRDFVGNQRFQFAGARDRALDAVAHRRDLAADRLTDGYHRVACRTLRFGKADRNLRHRLRDHAHFLAAPGEAGEEIKQHHRCEEQRDEAGQHQQAAALTHRGLQRGHEGKAQQPADRDPDDGDDGRDREHAAGGTALLDRLQNLPDGLAVVIGGAPRRARLFDRLEDRPVGARAGIECGLVKCGLVIGRRRGRSRRRHIAAHRAARVVRDRTVADVEGFLNGRKRDFSRVFDLFGIVRHVQPEPSCYLYASPKILRERPRQA